MSVRLELTRVISAVVSMAAEMSSDGRTDLMTSTVGLPMEFVGEDELEAAIAADPSIRLVVLVRGTKIPRVMAALQREFGQPAATMVEKMAHHGDGNVSVSVIDNPLSPRRSDPSRN